MNFFTILQNASASEKYRNHASFELGPFEGVEQAGKKTQVILIWRPGGKPLILKKTAAGSNEPPQEWEIRKTALAQSNNNQPPAIRPEKAADHFSEFDLAEAYKQYNGKLNSTVKPTAPPGVIASLVLEPPRKRPVAPPTLIVVSARDPHPVSPQIGSRPSGASTPPHLSKPQNDISVETALIRILKEYLDSKWKKQEIEIGPFQASAVIGGGEIWLTLNPGGSVELSRITPGKDPHHNVLTATSAEADKLNGLPKGQRARGLAIPRHMGAAFFEPRDRGKILETFHDKLSFLSERAAEIRKLMEYMREERRKLMEYEAGQRIYTETITFNHFMGSLLSDGSYDLIPIWSRHIHGPILFQVDFRNKRANRESSNRFIIALSQQELDAYDGDFLKKYDVKEAILPEDAAIFFSKTTAEEIRAGLQRELSALSPQAAGPQSQASKPNTTSPAEAYIKIQHALEHLHQEQEKYRGKNWSFTLGPFVLPLIAGRSTTILWRSDEQIEIEVKSLQGLDRIVLLHTSEAVQEFIAAPERKLDGKEANDLRTAASLFPEGSEQKILDDFKNELDKLLQPDGPPKHLIAG